MVRLPGEPAPPTSAGRASLHFHCAHGFAARALACTLDSLVRVSRRVGWRHFVSILETHFPSVGRTAQAARLKDGATRAPLPPAPRSPARPAHADSAAAGARPRPRERSLPRLVLGPTASLSAISSPFHSLFKVLFIFPSRYLFAIGLLLIFSFRWNLPPA